MPGLDGLTPQQRTLLRAWLPAGAVVRDHSWGLVGTTVLELRTPDGRRYIAKAGDTDDHHLARELSAHRRWLAPLAAHGHAPTLMRGDDAAKLLVAEYLPGTLVQGADSEWAPDTYRQAGALLALLHGLDSARDDGQFERRQKQETLAWLGRAHRIPADAAAALAAEASSWPTPPAALVPTHGDWQPRNWIADDGRIRMIDFGRADLRPAQTDFARLAAQQFRGRPELEAAFLAGYGADPRERASWRRLRIREAVATAGWAHRVGDRTFEQQGLRMVTDVLAELVADRS